MSRELYEHLRPPASQGNYLEWSEFERTFPQRGEVHVTETSRLWLNDDYVVKCQTSQGFIPEARSLRELHFLGSLRHPHLLPLTKWSYRVIPDPVLPKTEIYQALPRGVLLSQAVRDGLISPSDAAIGIISAVVFLHRQGIVHGSLKASHCLFYDGRAQLIDFGWSQYYQLNIDGRDLVKGRMGGYRDPEYSPLQWNSITTEDYCLARTIVEVAGGTVHGFYFISPSTSPEVDDFARAFLVPEAKRPSLEHRLSTVGGVWDVPGTVIDSPIVNSPPDYLKRHLLYFGVIVEDLCRPTTELSRMSARTLFNTVHLYRRIIGRVLYTDEKGGVTEHNIIAAGLACLVLAWAVGEQPDSPFPSESKLYEVLQGRWRDLTQALEYGIRHTIFEILVATQGVIRSVTYWDHARISEELSSLLSEMVSPSYDPTSVALADDIFYTDKNVTAREIQQHVPRKRLRREVVRQPKLGFSQIREITALEAFYSTWHDYFHQIMAHHYGERETQPVWEDYEKTRGMIGFLFHNLDELKELKIDEKDSLLSLAREILPMLDPEASTLLALRT